MRRHAQPFLFLSLFLILASGGCRRPIAPTFERNLAPETWITAAPLDTITIREGPNPEQTDPRFIPFRFRLYWAGSDPDGKVVGFYFAVVETLPVPIPPSPDPPPLPGPRAGDYRYTARTDSVFVFSVNDERRDRQHTFYIYAVDDRGRADPTPARFIFNAIDRYPPLPRITSLTATGFVWEQDPWTRRLTRRLSLVSVPETDTFVIGARPKTTVPSASRLDIAWTSEVTTPDNEAVGYRYRLDEPEWVDVGATTTRASYNTGPGDAVGPGFKVFRLRAVDRAGGAGNTSRVFQMNHPPTTWFAGPDRDAPVWTRQGNRVFVNVPDWENVPDLSSAGLLSADSFQVLPSQREPRRTFYEIYGNRIYARQERDTIHMNSWIAFHHGGFDADSPYNVVYAEVERTTPDSSNAPVLQIRPPNGSPIGFRSRIPVLLSPNGGFSNLPQTGLYPTFDPGRNGAIPSVASYWPMRESGTAYLFARAEDGNGDVDARIGSTSELSPERIVHAVDSTGTATPEQIALRPLVLTFFVNRAPFFNFTTAVTPRPNQSLPNRTLTFVNFRGSDDDPLDPLVPIGIGGPSASGVLRYTVSFRALRNGGLPGDSVTFAPLALQQVATVAGSFDFGDSLGGTRVRVMVELCDCAFCESEAGRGRCRFYSWLITVPAPPLAEASAAVSSRPGHAVLTEERRGKP